MGGHKWHRLFSRYALCERWLTHRLVHREPDYYYHEVVGEETAREQAKTVEERSQKAGTEGRYSLDLLSTTA